MKRKFWQNSKPKSFILLTFLISCLGSRNYIYSGGLNSVLPFRSHERKHKQLSQNETILITKASFHELLKRSLRTKKVRSRRSIQFETCAWTYKRAKRTSEMITTGGDGQWKWKVMAHVGWKSSVFVARTGFTKCLEFEGRWFAPASSNNARTIVNFFGGSRGWFNVRECSWHDV